MAPVIHTGGAQRLIWVAEVSPAALSNPSAQEACLSLSDVGLTHIVSTQPAINFQVTAAVASANGHHLLLVGSSEEVSWHPASPNHFAALASDNRWRLYHSSQLSEAEQTFWLRPAGAHTAAATLGIRRGGGSSGSTTPPRFTDVAQNDQYLPPPAAAAAHIISPLLLLDALKINLHMPPASERDEEEWLEAEGQVGSATDSEEESDAGYDPTASSRPAALAATGPSSSGRGLAVLDGDEDDDLEDQQLLQLRQVTLQVAPELPGRFWACHDQGCWGINIRWLQLLASRASSSSTPASVVGIRDELPAPSLQELLVADGPAGGVVSSCVVGNALLGSGCVALEGSGQLWFLRPRPAGVLGAGVVEGVAAGGTEPAGQEGSAGLDDLQGMGLSEVQLTAEELDAKAQMEDFYGDICRGPRRLPAPAKPSNLSQLTAADPAGLAYLNAVTSWLLSTHVQFATGAHADLVARVAGQSSALAILQELASAAAARQADMAGRLARLSEVAGNLVERGQLLAGLHWSLPRPPSAAEQQLEKQLEVCAGQDTARGRVQVTATSPGPIAAAQLEKLKQALEMQNNTIAEANARLAGLFEEVEEFRAEHPEVDLPGKLRHQLNV
eukprot:gene5806-6048_t